MKTPLPRSFLATIDAQAIGRTLVEPAAEVTLEDGRVFLRLGDRHHHFPRQTDPKGTVTVENDGCIRVDYLPGVKGALGEAGILLEPMTPTTWARWRAGDPEIPNLTRQREIDEWCRLHCMV